LAARVSGKGDIRAPTDSGPETIIENPRCDCRSPTRRDETVTFAAEHNRKTGTTWDRLRACEL